MLMMESEGESSLSENLNVAKSSVIKRCDGNSKTQILLHS